MKNPIPAGLLLAALVLGSGCTVSVTNTNKVTGPDLATQVANMLKEQAGVATAPSIDCGTESIDLTNGKIVTCALTDAGAVYDVTVTLSNVQGSTFQIDARVASTPRA